MKKTLLLSLLLVCSCADLERETDSPSKPLPPKVIVEVPPDASAPTADAGTCEDEPDPPCSCQEDCGEGQVCIEGTCHRTCNEDYDCGNHKECHSHVCYNPHGG